MPAERQMACCDAVDDEKSMSRTEAGVPEELRLNGARGGGRASGTTDRVRTSIRRYLAPAGLGLGLSAVVLLARLSGVWETAGAGEAAAPESSSLAPVALPAYDAPVSAPVVRRLALPHTEVPERPRVSVLRYSVQLGDTAWSIADQFGLKPETLLWGNEGLSSEAGSLQIGRELNILPVDGVLHTVKEGETLESLQAFYDVPAEAILEFPGNGLASHAAVELLPGQELIIPGATKAVAWVEPGPRVLAGQGRRSPGFYSGPLVYLGTGYFQWPVSPVRITQSYWSGHPAIDLDTYFRQPVFASDSGTVIYSKWDTTG